MKQILTGLALLMLSVSLLAQSSLAGRVMDTEGQPIQGAYVIILKTNLGAVTDEKGKYVIDKVPNGEYDLKISHVSYRTLKRKLIMSGETPRYIINLQMVEDVVGLDALIVKATRADEKTPMTYTNLGKEEIEKGNLGQDVPFLLRWSPSAVVTSDAGAGVGYTGIRIRGTDPTRINVTINGIPLNDSESQNVFWVDLPDFASSTEDIQIQRGVGTSTNGAGAFGASINLNTNKIHREPYGILSGTVGSFNTWKTGASFGSGLINDHFTFDGRISRISSDGYIDRATSDLESFYLSGAYLGKRSSLRFNVFSGKEVTYQAWNGVPAQYIDDKKLRTFNTGGMERADKPHPNEVDDYTQTHYQALFNHQFNRNWNLNLAAHYTKGSGYFEQYKASQGLGDYGLDNLFVNEVLFGLNTTDELIENFIDNEDVEVDTEIIWWELAQDSFIQATYSIKETDLIRRRWLDNDFYGTTYSLSYTSDSRKIDAVIGGAWNQYQGQHFGEVIWAEYFSNGEQGHRYYDNDATKTDFNIFGKMNYQLTGALNAFLDLQYRKVDYEFLGFDQEGVNLRQEDQLHFFNPKVGLFYDLGKKRSLYASFGVANREPNRNDYTESSPSSRPNPETLFNTEIGYRHNFEKAAFGINFYQMLYKDQLALTGQLNDVGAATRVNIEDSYRMGLEMVGGIRLSDGLELNANLTLSQNKVKNFIEYIDNWDTGVQEKVEHENTDLALSPNIIAGAGLSYDIFNHKPDQSLTFTLLGKYVGKQYIDNTSNENTVLDPYFFSDFRINFNLKNKFTKAIGLTLMVRNVFDNHFSTNAWTYRYKSGFYDARPDDPYARLEGGDTYNLTGFYPQAGRNYLLGLTFKF